MAVTYLRLPAALSRDREQVSRQWYVLLHDLGDVGNVNEGHRTFTRQLQLVRLQGVLSLRNPHGAALPSPFAPHIRTGRPDHAIDVDNSQAYIDAARRRGVTLTRTVSTEAWHLEANPSQLAAYYAKHKARVLGIGHRTLHPGMRGKDVEHAQRLLKKKGVLAHDHKVGSLYGHRMAVRVRAWKRRHGLPHDSVIGPRVWKKLER